MAPGEKVYIGDSVYAADGCYPGEVVLTTENGMGPSNTIVLGPDEVASLLRFFAPRFKTEGLVQVIREGGR